MRTFKVRGGLECVIQDTYNILRHERDNNAFRDDRIDDVTGNRKQKSAIVSSTTEFDSECETQAVIQQHSQFQDRDGILNGNNRLRVSPSK
jgi:hypothetical protein